MSDNCEPRFPVCIFQLALKFPDMGQVKVDRMGNIVGGANPFEGMDIEPENQPSPEDEEVNADCIDYTTIKDVAVFC